jgi:hypothetical protein
MLIFVNLSSCGHKALHFCDSATRGTVVAMGAVKLADAEPLCGDTRQAWARVAGGGRG